MPEHVLSFSTFQYSRAFGSCTINNIADNLHGMLEHIPFISLEGLNAHFELIDSKLSAYKAKLFAFKGSTILELAIWKMKIEEHIDGVIDVLDVNMKMRCHALILY